MDTEEEFAWPTANFRQSVAQKIDEAVANVSMSCNRTGVELENYLYRTAKSKDEYMWIVYELVLYMVEMRYGKKPRSGEPDDEDDEDEEEEEESDKEGEEIWIMDEDATEIPK